jgi:hypothetical protein
MLYALDVDGTRVSADWANRGEKYTCPICNKTKCYESNYRIYNLSHRSYL